MFLFKIYLKPEGLHFYTLSMLAKRSQPLACIGIGFLHCDGSFTKYLTSPLKSRPYHYAWSVRDTLVNA